MDSNQTIEAQSQINNSSNNVERLLKSLIDEVKSLKNSQKSLESKIETLGVLPPSSPVQDFDKRNSQSRLQSSTQLINLTNTSAERNQKLPTIINKPSSSSSSSSNPVPIPIPIPQEGSQTNNNNNSNSFSSSPKALRRGSQLEDEGNFREKIRFSDWMKAEAEAAAAAANTEILNDNNDYQKIKSQSKPEHRNIYPQRVILTTYPGQTGIKPIPLDWGNPDPQLRGPVVASRHPQSLKIRNAIGAYSGSYCIYKALATAIGAIDPNHRPDYTNTEPPFNVSPNPSWSDASKIVSMDPWGHLTTQIFKHHFDFGVDIRPTVACTKAHLKLAELDEAVAEGRILIDGKIVVKSPGSWASAAAETAYRASVTGIGSKWEDLSEDEHQIITSKKAGVEVPVTKAAVEPVWNLPGVASRFGISEAILRRALFEDTGGMYPELLTRNDLKTYLPPIGGLTVYIFGDPEFVSDESKELTLRVHDECNGSDVFGSSICTCRPYLLYGIEEAIKCAQRGGSGVVVYFRKEGRALGEVTKYLVYNARKRGGDSAALYFQRTESIAGVKDMRFQALMPDVLHWLGIKKIDVMCSMSDMKHDAIVQSGIPIILRKDIPDHLIPSDSRVEIDAKIAAGYFSASKVVTEDDLKNTIGRGWEDVDH